MIGLVLEGIFFGVGNFFLDMTIIGFDVKSFFKEYNFLLNNVIFVKEEYMSLFEKCVK